MIDFSDIRELLQEDARARLEEKEAPYRALWLEAYDYREWGFTYRTIAQNMGVSLRTAHRYVLKGTELKQRLRENCRAFAAKEFEAQKVAVSTAKGPQRPYLAGERGHK